jgi:hypothetical protein
MCPLCSTEGVFAQPADNTFILTSVGQLLRRDQLMMTPGGRERTANEFRVLLAGAQFALARVVPTGSPLSIIEACPL